MKDLAYCNECTLVQLLTHQVVSVMDIYTDVRRVACKGNFTIVYLQNDIMIKISSRFFKVEHNGFETIEFQKENGELELCDVIASVLKMMNIIEGKEEDASRRFRQVSGYMKEFCKFFNYFMSVNIYEWTWEPNMLYFYFDDCYSVWYYQCCRLIKDDVLVIDRSFADTYETLKSDNFDENLKYSILLANPNHQF